MNCIAKTAMEVFEDILQKPKLERNDLELIIEQIRVYEDHIEIQLKADIDAILQSGTLPSQSEETVAAIGTEGTANFPEGIVDSLQAQFVQSSKNRLDKVYDVHVVSDGDPLEIFTEKQGDIILKKYSPIGELAAYAGFFSDAISRTLGKS